jgi:hypothetical protein
MLRGTGAIGVPMRMPKSESEVQFKVSADPVLVIREGDESGWGQRHELPKKEAVRDRKQAVTLNMIIPHWQASVHKMDVLSVLTRCDLPARFAALEKRPTNVRFEDPEPT